MNIILYKRRIKMNTLPFPSDLTSFLSKKFFTNQILDDTHIFLCDELILNGIKLDPGFDYRDEILNIYVPNNSLSKRQIIEVMRYNDFESLIEVFYNLNKNDKLGLRSDIVLSKELVKDYKIFRIDEYEQEDNKKDFIEDVTKNYSIENYCSANLLGHPDYWDYYEVDLEQENQFYTNNLLDFLSHQNLENESSEFIFDKIELDFGLQEKKKGTLYIPKKLDSLKQLGIIFREEQF